MIYVSIQTAPPCPTTWPESGPKLSPRVEADTLDESIEIINANQYGNGASVFTSSGYNARVFQHACEAGQLGINVPIPVALPFFSFSGNKKSFWGDLHM